MSFASTGNRPQFKQYEFVKLAEIVDWINIMSYDQHVPNHSEWNAVTGLNSSLYSNPNEPEPEEVVKHFNVAFICQEMIRLGVPKAKLNAGFPFYGKGYSDVPSINNGLFQEYKGISNQGTWTPGIFDYWDLKAHFVNKNGFVKYWDEYAQVPWLYSKDTATFITYDDEKSI